MMESKEFIAQLPILNIAAGIAIVLAVIFIEKLPIAIKSVFTQ